MRVFLGPDDQKCFQRVLLGFVDWGPKSYFWETGNWQSLFYLLLNLMLNLMAMGSRFQFGFSKFRK